MLNKIKENYLFAVIRGKDEKDAIEIAKSAIKGGIKNIEVTYTTPNASVAIKELSELYKNDDSVIVGAGTVMDEGIAKEAIVAGAKFLVSPHLSKEVSKISKEYNTLYFPGVFTVSEIVEAINMDCEIIKLFPASFLKPSFIKDVKGPLPNVSLMPSGGVSLENILEWKKAGAVAVGIGSFLSKDVKEKGYESVSEKAKLFIDKLKDENI